MPFLHVVSNFKHVGSIVSHDGTMMADANLRVQSATRAYAPLAHKFFGSSMIDTHMKLSFGSALVESRLFNNVHLWSVMHVPALKRLNAMYMRMLRKIADCSKFDASCVSDIAVRVKLEAPSLESIFRTKRLMYASRLARLGPKSLKAMLSSVCNGKRMPWSVLLSRDLDVMYAALPVKFSVMPPPSANPSAWLAIMTDHPAEWKALVKLLKFHESAVDSEATAFAPSASLQSHLCTICSAPYPVFASRKGLCQHMRVAHGIRNHYRTFVDDSGKCPVCRTCLHTRLRVLAHLSDPRRNTTCRDAIDAGQVRALPSDRVAQLDALDTARRTAARRDGHTHCLATRSAVRSNGKQCGRPAKL